MDAEKIAAFYQQEIQKYPNIHLQFQVRIQYVEKNQTNFNIYLQNQQITTAWVLNTSYANLNGIHTIFGIEAWNLRYELTEMILVQVPDFFQQIGFTLMDGPFFSLMPFGLQNIHSLSAVNLTPHQQTDKNPICLSK